MRNLNRLINYVPLILFISVLVIFNANASNSGAIIYTEKEIKGKDYEIKLNAHDKLQDKKFKLKIDLSQAVEKKAQEAKSKVAINTKPKAKDIEKIVNIGKVEKEVIIRARKARAIDPRSKGIWVNLWNYPKDTETFMAKLKKFKINTIYLQVNRSNTPVFKHKKKIDEILKVAHAYKIKVIGWSYCFLNNITSDADKYIKPALYVSPDGHKFDGMAADIEENIAEWAIKKYTDIIKEAVPEDYPLYAIVYAPKIKPKYPWKYIGNNWDVVMPMAYWHGYKNRKQNFVFDFIKHTISEIRRLSGNEYVKIHLITDGDRTTTQEVKESLKAARKYKINAGISIYPEHLASENMLEALKDY